MPTHHSVYREIRIYRVAATIHTGKGPKVMPRYVAHPNGQHVKAVTENGIKKEIDKVLDQK